MYPGINLLIDHYKFALQNKQFNAKSILIINYRLDFWHESRVNALKWNIPNSKYTRQEDAANILNIFDVTRIFILSY